MLIKLVIFSKTEKNSKDNYRVDNTLKIIQL